MSGEVILETGPTAHDENIEPGREGVPEKPETGRRELQFDPTAISTEIQSRPSIPCHLGVLRVCLILLLTLTWGDALSRWHDQKTAPPTSTTLVKPSGDESAGQGRLNNADTLGTMPRTRENPGLSLVRHDRSYPPGSETPKMLFKRILPAVGLTLAVVGCAPNPADDKPVATVLEPSENAPADTPAIGTSEPDATTAEPVETEAVDATPAETAGARSLEIDPASSKIEFVGSKVTGKHEGGFKTFSGNVDLGDGDTIKSLSAKIEMDSVYSDADRLTGHLKTPDFFDVAKYPTSTFESTEITPAESGTEDATHNIKGDLTLHGVTKTIVFPAKLTVNDSAASIDSEFVLNRKDFEISYSGKADDLIRDEVVIKLSIEAPK